MRKKISRPTTFEKQSDQGLHVNRRLSVVRGYGEWHCGIQGSSPYSSTMKIKVREMSQLEMLEMLREAFLKVASAETSCAPGYYQEHKEKGTLPSPLLGHCGAVATAIQAAMGGVVVTGRVNNEPHYWNRLPDGKEVDLTSCQYGGDGFTPFKKGRKVRDRKGLVHPRFLIFIARVHEELGSGRKRN